MDKAIRIVAVLFAVVAVACIAVLFSSADAGNSDGVTGASGPVPVSSTTIYFFLW
jgi:hypothetical protein